MAASAASKVLVRRAVLLRITPVVGLVGVSLLVALLLMASALGSRVVVVRSLVAVELLRRRELVRPPGVELVVPGVPVVSRASASTTLEPATLGCATTSRERQRFVRRSPRLGRLQHIVVAVRVQRDLLVVSSGGIFDLIEGPVKHIIAIRFCPLYPQVSTSSFFFFFFTNLETSFLRISFPIRTVFR